MRLLVLGATDFSSEVADIAAQSGFSVAGFVENFDRNRGGGSLDGLPIHWIDDIGALAADHVAVCGLGTTHRSRFTDHVAALGFGFATVVHPSAVVSPTCRIGEGSIVGALVAIGAHSTIGRHVLVNRGVLLGHHLHIGDYTSILPGAKIASSCSIGEAAYVGMGATVIDHLRIGSHSVVAAGAVVMTDVADNVMVAGMPARVHKTGIDGK